jgi:hypothetical protein
LCHIIWSHIISLFVFINLYESLNEVSEFSLHFTWINVSSIQNLGSTRSFNIVSHSHHICWGCSIWSLLQKIIVFKLYLYLRAAEIVEHVCILEHINSTSNMTSFPIVLRHLMMRLENTINIKNLEILSRVVNLTIMRVLKDLMPR